MTCHAAVAVTVLGGLSLDGFDELVELIRETAYPMPSGRTILIQWEADNYWQLRGLVQETRDAMESSFYGYFREFDIDEPGDGSDTNLARFQVWVGGKPEPRLPYRDIGYTAFECERDMAKAGFHCPDPDAHDGEANRFLHMQDKSSGPS